MWKSKEIMINTIKKSKVVEIGSVVEVIVSDRFRTFQIVRDVSEDDEGSLIAYDTSLGRSLLGRHVQDRFSHTLFDGSLVQITVLAIR